MSDSINYKFDVLIGSIVIICFRNLLCYDTFVTIQKIDDFMAVFRFSGHDTFIVRSFWPKKGYDFLNSNGKFSAEDAVVDLGVHFDMVY